MEVKLFGMISLQPVAMDKTQTIDIQCSLIYTHYDCCCLSFLRDTGRRPGKIANTMDDQALKLWQEKKQYLETALAIATSAAQQFELRHQIADCQANIERLITTERVFTNAEGRSQTSTPQTTYEVDKQPRDKQPMADSFLRVIVFTDLVDSTPMKKAMAGTDIMERNQCYDDQVLEPHRQRIRTLLEQFQGREREEPQGDGFLLEFPNPILAGRFAVRVQLSHQNQPILDGEESAIQVKIGMHVGYPEAKSEVDYAARVVGCATGGQILISESLYGLLKDADIAGISFHSHGQVYLKGIGDRPLFELLYGDQMIRPIK